MEVQKGGSTMRRLTILAAAAALFSAATLMSAPSQAMPLGSGVQGGAETLNPVDKAACWRYGWHGYGWYPCYYGPRVYGWYGRPWGGWGWHRHWRHW
jgi:hypothetical protein